MLGIDSDIRVTRITCIGRGHGWLIAQRSRYTARQQTTCRRSVFVNLFAPNDGSGRVKRLPGFFDVGKINVGHDFCTISLSDLLTPWEDIQRRVTAAAEGDFVIAFYNPVSKKRRTQLAYARDVLLEHRPADTPVILATNLGRDGEAVRIVPLAELDVDDVDMLTVVIVGSSNTRLVATGDGKRWAYTPRGYARKEGTGIEGGYSGSASLK